MVNNPFSSMIQMMRDEGSSYNPLPTMIGKVITTFPTITIKIGDLIIDNDDILISGWLNASLGRGATFTVTATSGIAESNGIHSHSAPTGGTSSDGDHTHDVTINSLSGTLDYINYLNVGDNVLVLATEDKQTFIILDKVVSL